MAGCTANIFVILFVFLAQRTTCSTFPSRRLVVTLPVPNDLHRGSRNNKEDVAAQAWVETKLAPGKFLFGHFWIGKDKESHPCVALEPMKKPKGKGNKNKSWENVTPNFGLSKSGLNRTHGRIKKLEEQDHPSEEQLKTKLKQLEIVLNVKDRDKKPSIQVSKAAKRKALKKGSKKQTEDSFGKTTTQKPKRVGRKSKLKTTKIEQLVIPDSHGIKNFFGPNAKIVKVTEDPNDSAEGALLDILHDAHSAKANALNQASVYLKEHGLKSDSHLLKKLRLGEPQSKKKRRKPRTKERATSETEAPEAMKKNKKKIALSSLPNISNLLSSSNRKGKKRSVRTQIKEDSSKTTITVLYNQADEEHPTRKAKKLEIVLDKDGKIVSATDATPTARTGRRAMMLLPPKSMERKDNSDDIVKSISRWMKMQNLKGGGNEDEEAEKQVHRKIQSEVMKMKRLMEKIDRAKRGKKRGKMNHFQTSTTTEVGFPETLKKKFALTKHAGLKKKSAKKLHLTKSKKRAQQESDLVSNFLDGKWAQEKLSERTAAGKSTKSVKRWRKPKKRQIIQDSGDFLEGNLMVDYLTGKVAQLSTETPARISKSRNRKKKKRQSTENNGGIRDSDISVNYLTGEVTQMSSTENSKRGKKKLDKSMKKRRNSRKRQLTVNSGDFLEGDYDVDYMSGKVTKHTTAVPKARSDNMRADAKKALKVLMRTKLKNMLRGRRSSNKSKKGHSKKSKRKSAKKNKRKSLKKSKKKSVMKSKKKSVKKSKRKPVKKKSRSQGDDEDDGSK